MGLAVAVPLLQRGVWTADYLIEGHPVLHAIDSNGNCLRRVKMSPAVDETCARAWLNGLLDHYDPMLPRLSLVTSSTTTRLSPFYIPRLRRCRR